MDPRERDPEAKRKNRVLTKVAVLLEACIDLESKNNEQLKKHKENHACFIKVTVLLKDFIVFRPQIYRRLKQNHDFCQIPWIFFFFFLLQGLSPGDPLAVPVPLSIKWRCASIPIFLLCMALDRPHELEFVSIQSYGDST